MTHKTLSRKASTVIVVGLLLATGGLAVTAAATSADTLLPLLRGEPWAGERALSQRTVALAVHVGTFEGENRTAADGATVSLYRMPAGTGAGAPMNGRPLRADGPPAGLDNRTPVATGTTDSDGRIVFDVRRGPYVVAVTYGNMSGRDFVPVPRDTRLGVAFDETGQAHFVKHDRRDLHEYGEVVPLHIHVVRVLDGNHTPVEEYQVIVSTREPLRSCPITIADQIDDPHTCAGLIQFGPKVSNGTSIQHVVPVKSGLRVSLPDGARFDTRLDIRGPTSVTLVIDEEGNGTFTVRPPQ